MRAQLLALVGICGCSSLVSSDIEDIYFELPDNAFEVNADLWNLDSSFPTVECPANDCDAVAATFCPDGGCTVQCGGVTCEAAIFVAAFQTFNLSEQVAELSDLAEQTIITVTLDTVAFSITENTLNVATPEFAMYMGPITAVDGSSADASVMGTLTEIPAGSTGDKQIELSSAGHDLVQEVMTNYRTPFNLIVEGSVTIHADDPVPQGRLVGTVTIGAHASVF